MSSRREVDMGMLTLLFMAWQVKMELRSDLATLFKVKVLTVSPLTTSKLSSNRL